MADEKDLPSKGSPQKSAGSPPSDFHENHFSHAIQYLRDRGVEPEMFDQLGIEILPAAKWLTETYGGKSKDPRIAIKFNHYNPHQEQLEWNSVKFITPKSSGLTFSKESKKPTRSSKKNAMIHAYLCPLKNWRDLQQGQRIFFCESVLKAANVAMLGYHAIGLNGVAAFSSLKHKVELLPEITDLPWQKLNLQPFILFDSDFIKPDIEKAFVTLATKLSLLCQSQPARLLPLKPGPDGDWGFDDARHALGDEWATKFLKGKGGEIKLDDVRMGLFQLNDIVVVARNISTVIELETGTMMSESKFKGLNYANRIAFDVEGKEVKLADRWLRWKDRSEVEKVEYVPGGELVHDDRYNLWKGMGIEPVEGDVTPWLDVLSNNIRDEAERKYLEQWCAYPIQNLGEKMMVSPVLVGTQGIGKSLFGQALGAVYGADNYKEITREEITNDFNSAWVKSQLVVIEEMRGERKTDRAFMSTLKKNITSDQYIVNQKHVPQYRISNYVNFMLTTNDADALAFEGEDRRFFVAHFKPVVDRYRDSGYWNVFVDWLRSDGPAALHHYLLHVDLEGFHPGAPAPETAYKQVMETASHSGPEAFIKALWDGEVDLPSQRLLWTSRELTEVYGEGDVRDGPAMANMLSKLLLRRGFEQANNGKSIGDRRTGKMRYFVIRDRDNPDWDSHATCLTHLRKYTKELQKY